MQPSTENYQAVFFTKIDIGTFNILLQLNLDQIKVGFTLINKIHADVKNIVIYNRYLHQHWSTENSRKILSSNTIPVQKVFYPLSLFSKREMVKKTVENMIRML